MFERLGKDALLYGLTTLLVRGIQILLIPVYSRVLSTSEYGMIETVAIVGALVNLSVALEISQGMARYIADAATERDRQAYATTAVCFCSSTYGVFALLVAVFQEDLGRWLLGEQTTTHVLTLAACAIAVNGVFVIVQDLLRWQLRSGSYLIAGLAYTLGSAGVGIWLVTVQGLGVAGVFWGQLAGATLGGAVSLWRASGLLARVFDPNRLRTMLRYSLPLVLSGVAVFGNMFIDRIVVREVLGLDALGIYGVTARFASAVSILAVGLQVALSPLVFRHWREPSTAPTLASIFRWYLVAMVPLVGAISLFSREIMTALTGPAFHAGSSILPLLTLGAMFSTLYVFAPGLFLGERTGRVALLNVTGALVNLILSLTFTPWLNVSGAALAATIAPAVVFAGYVLLGRAWFKVSYERVKAAASLGVVIILVLIGLEWQPEAASWVPSVIISKIGLLLLSTLCVYRFGLNMHDRKALLHRILARSR